MEKPAALADARNPLDKDTVHSEHSLKSDAAEFDLSVATGSHLLGMSALSDQQLALELQQIDDLAFADILSDDDEDVETRDAILAVQL